MFGFPGGYGYPGLGMGQSIPPHPPSAAPAQQLRNGVAGQPLHSPPGGHLQQSAAAAGNQSYQHNQDFNNQVSL